MNVLRRLSFFSLFLIAAFPALAQGKKLNKDSLLRVISLNRQDTATANALIEISRIHRSKSPDSAILFLHKALSLAERLSSKKHIARACTGLGVIYNFQSIGDSSLRYLGRSLKIARALNDPYLEAETEGNIGISYFNKVQYAAALEHYFRALRIYESVKEEHNISKIYNNIANLYFIQDDNKRALEYYTLSLRIAFRENDKYKLASTYNNIALIYGDMGLHDTALVYQKKSLAMAEEMKDEFGIGLLHSNIGKSYFRLGRYGEAIGHFKQAITIKTDFGDVNGLLNAYSSLGDCYFKTREYGKAIESYRKGIEAGEGNKNYGVLSDAAKGLYHAYKTVGKTAPALAALEMYATYNDSAIKLRKVKEIEELSRQYETGKKEAQIRILEKDQELVKLKVQTQEADLKKQKLVILSISFILLLLAVLSYFIYKSYRQKKRDHATIVAQKDEVELQKRIIEEKQKEILDSIHYAKRIQRSLLPSDKYLERVLRRTARGPGDLRS
jgi:tetratricopeptide (TPR) repeat protein